MFTLTWCKACGSVTDASVVHAPCGHVYHAACLGHWARLMLGCWRHQSFAGPMCILGFPSVMTPMSPLFKTTWQLMDWFTVTIGVNRSFEVDAFFSNSQPFFPETPANFSGKNRKPMLQLKIPRRVSAHSEMLWHEKWLLSWMKRFFHLRVFLLDPP